MSGGFFRGTSADQDTRFSNKQAKLLKSQKFPPELEHLVDMTKVKMDVIRPWIATRVTELLGFEDEVLIYFIYGLLEGKEADGKQIQIQLTGFMEKNTGKFMKELWGLLLSAQKNASGVPQQFLDAKEQELKKKQHEADRIGLEGRRRERGGWGPEPDKANKTDGKTDTVEAAEGPRLTSAAVSSAKQLSMEDGSPRSDDNIKTDRRHGSRRKSRHSPSAHSDDKSLSSNRRSPSASRSRSRSFSNSRGLSEERHKSRSVSVSPRHRRRSISPERRYLSPKRNISPRRAPRSPVRRQSPHYRRRSTSRSRHRSPLVRRRSPLRRRSPNLRHRSPSPLRHRSPSPHRRYSPRRRSPIHNRRRSPSPRRSPIRRRTPPKHLSPPRKGSPPPRSPRYRRRTPPASAPKWSRSPQRSQTPQRSRRSPNRSPIPSSEKTGGLDIGYKRPDPSLRRQAAAGSPSYKSRDDNDIKDVASVKPISPEKSKLSLKDIDGKPNGKRIHASSLSPNRHSKERRLHDGSDASEGEENATRHYTKPKVDSSHSNRSPLKSKSRVTEEEASLPEDVSHRRQKLAQLNERHVHSSHRNAIAANSQRERPMQSISNSPQDVEYGPGVVGGGSVPLDPVFDGRSSAKGYSLEVERHSHEPKKPTSVSDVDDRRSTLKVKDNANVHGSDKKNKRKMDQQDLSSNSEDDRTYKGSLAGRKSTNSRKDTSDDESGHQSDSIDRKERKRRKKEEKRLRKEEKRRRREERHRRKEERRAAKHKSKHLDTEPASDDDQNLGYSDSEVEREQKSSDKEDAESEQKKLEIRLREKALESLRAKKAIAH